MSFTTLELLEGGRAILHDPERWTHDAFARTSYFKSTEPESADAVCWCAVGALRALGTDRSTIDCAWVGLRDVAREWHASSPSWLNDSSNHATVLAMYDEAIRRERERVGA